MVQKGYKTDSHPSASLRLWPKGGIYGGHRGVSKHKMRFLTEKPHSFHLPSYHCEVIEVYHHGQSHHHGIYGGEEKKAKVSTLWAKSVCGGRGVWNGNLCHKIQPRPRPIYVSFAAMGCWLLSGCWVLGSGFWEIPCSDNTNWVQRSRSIEKWESSKFSGTLHSFINHWRQSGEKAVSGFPGRQYHNTTASSINVKIENTQSPGIWALKPDDYEDVRSRGARKLMSEFLALDIFYIGGRYRVWLPRFRIYGAWGRMMGRRNKVVHRHRVHPPQHHRHRTHDDDEDEDGATDATDATDSDRFMRIECL